MLSIDVELWVLLSQLVKHFDSRSEFRVPVSELLVGLLLLGCNLALGENWLLLFRSFFGWSIHTICSHLTGSLLVFCIIVVEFVIILIVIILTILFDIFLLFLDNLSFFNFSRGFFLFLFLF